MQRSSSLIDDDDIHDPAMFGTSMQQRFSKTLSDVLKTASSCESEAVQVTTVPPLVQGAQQMLL